MFKNPYKNKWRKRKEAMMSEIEEIMTSESQEETTNQIQEQVGRKDSITEKVQNISE